MNPEGERPADLDDPSLALKADALAEAVAVGMARPELMPLEPAASAEALRPQISWAAQPCHLPLRILDAEGRLRRILLASQSLGWSHSGLIDWEQAHCMHPDSADKEVRRREPQPLVAALRSGSPSATLREAEALSRRNDPDGSPRPGSRTALERLSFHARSACAALQRAGPARLLGRDWPMLGSPVRQALAHIIPALLRAQRETRGLSVRRGLSPSDFWVSPTPSERASLPAAGRVRLDLECALKDILDDMQFRKLLPSATPAIPIDAPRKRATATLLRIAAQAQGAAQAAAPTP